ncbi:MAG TPA: response regulator [Polyangiaceae bacterium]|jgi:excisionase family DNA binding protein
MKNEIVESEEAAPPELFTASEFASFCQVDLKTIHNWADKGEIRHFRTPGRHLRFRRLDVLDFLRKYGYPIPELLRVGRPKVVVIDDDPNVLAGVRRSLGRRFDVTTFQDPFEALVAVGTVQPDAIVLDLEMSGVDGLRCIERLKAMDSTSHIRTIVYSGQDDQKRAAMDAGASDFVPKGDVTMLRESIERMTGLERS